MKTIKHEYIKMSVTWADHFTNRGDFPLSEIQESARKPYYGEYTGYCVAETKQMLVLASNIWEDGSVSDPMFIMKKCIKERETHV